MASYTYYIDPSAGNDTTGNGSSGTPWKTFNKALVRSFASGDVVTVLVRPPATPFNDFVDLTAANHTGVSITIRPETPGQRIQVGMALARTNFIGTNQINTTPCSIELQDFDFTQATVFGWVLYCATAHPSVILTVRNSTMDVSTTRRIIGCSTSAYSDPLPSVLFYDTTITGGCEAFGAAGLRLKDFLLDGCTVTVGSTSTNTPLFSISRAQTFRVINSTINWITNQNYPILSFAPYNTTDITFDGTKFDATGFSGTTPTILLFDQCTTGSSVYTPITITNCTVLGNGVYGLLRIGRTDSYGTDKPTTRANMVDMFGQVTLQNSRFLNLANSGLVMSVTLGIGADGAIVDGCVIRNGNGSGQTGHGFGIYGDDIVITNTASIGWLNYLVFGNNCTISGCVGYGWGSCLIFGHTGDGHWAESTGGVVTNNLFIALSNGAEVCATDYAYNGQYVTVTFDHIVDRNYYFAKNGNLANWHNTVCDSVADMQAVWATWGTHPTNDANSTGRNGSAETDAVVVAGLQLMDVLDAAMAQATAHTADIRSGVNLLGAVGTALTRGTGIPRLL